MADNSTNDSSTNQNRNKNKRKKKDKFFDTSIKDFVDQNVCVLTCDGRNIMGTLKGHDQLTNVILEDCFERIFYEDRKMEEHRLGIYLIRGANIAVIGLVVPELDQEMTNNPQLRGQQCKPVVH